MSIETKPTDCDGPPYPQWGQVRSVDTSDVDWSGTALYSGAVTGTDADAAADFNDGEEPWREDGTAEPWGTDAGATTAEYAITTLAACGFAALLVVILKSEPIKELVTGVIQTALGLGA
ncbi:DUF4244 domain-containing protein [Brevibacterium sp. UCMA 11752]|uniref:DUF4244 domain-containing protein n=1 Tax=Brevibacterium sp. UCMA 11752 TaxID=2745946 RepID=UPI001F4529A5|nr:DUF4244 domain-containing protein [Brevibacterium sp. UCMA 11752]MCF2589078.1 DUF4244 domain-containing protein [Brevibacterium sp. UCMA 11752]